MLSFTTECPCCKRSFKILYSLTKHVRECQQGEEYSMNPAFKDGNGMSRRYQGHEGNLTRNIKKVIDYGLEVWWKE